MLEMHNHKLSSTICNYEQLISISYKYNQFENNDVSEFDWLGLHFIVGLYTPN